METIKTFKGLQKHLKFECPKLKINCQFCGNWHAREHFKDKKFHGCQEDFENMLDKFQGNINKVIEEDSSVELDEIHSLEGNTVQNNMQVRILEQ